MEMLGFVNAAEVEALRWGRRADVVSEEFEAWLIFEKGLDVEEAAEIAAFFRHVVKKLGYVPTERQVNEYYKKQLEPARVRAAARALAKQSNEYSVEAWEDFIRTFLNSRKKEYLRLSKLYYEFRSVRT